MEYECEFSFFCKILDECNLRHFLISPDEIIISRLDKGLGKIISGNDTKKTFRDFFPEINKNTVYRVCDLFMFTYVFFLLPEEKNEKIFITGPYLNTDVTVEMINSQAKIMHISENTAKELVLFYSSLPVIKEEHLLFASINTFSKLVFGGEFESKDIILEKSAAFIPGSIEIKPIAEETPFGFSVFEERYRFENELIEAVAKGNSRKAELMMSRFSVLTFESRTADSLRNIKNYCIIMNTLLRKAAEKGGVHPFYLNKVSTEFAIKTENMETVNDSVEFMLTVMRTYCSLVRNHSVKSYSPVVQKAVLRIENDLSGDLGLKTLAGAENVSPGYFSSLFKKETGHSLTEYVLNKRVEYAKHLLRTTNLQIGTIALNCGILDFHYFCRIFKRATGKTPTEYRNNILYE